MDKILNKHIGKYFGTISTADKAGEKILSTNSFMATIAAFIKCRTREGIAAKRVAMKMEEQLKSPTLDADVK